MAKKKDENIFEVEIVQEDGTKKTEVFKIAEPDIKDYEKAEAEYNRAFANAANSGALLRAKLEDFARRQGLWDDDKEAEVQSLREYINERTLAILQGGGELDDAAEKSYEIREARAKIRKIMADKNELDNKTAEGQADNAKFNYMVSATVVYNKTGKRYFKNYKDYLDNIITPVAISGAQKYASLMYGLNDNYEQELVENAFLMEFGFCDDRLRDIDDQGRLIDRQSGLLIDEENRFLDEDGNFIDINGNPVDADGNYKFKRKPFTKNGKVVKSKNKTTSETEEKISEKSESDKTEPVVKEAKVEEKETATTTE